MRQESDIHRKRTSHVVCAREMDGIEAQDKHDASSKTSFFVRALQIIRVIIAVGLCAWIYTSRTLNNIGDDALVDAVGSEYSCDGQNDQCVFDDGDMCYLNTVEDIVTPTPRLSIWFVVLVCLFEPLPQLGLLFMSDCCWKSAATTALCLVYPKIAVTFFGFYKNYHIHHRIMYILYVTYTVSEIIFGDMLFVIGQLLQSVVPSDKIQVVKARVEKAQKDDVSKAPLPRIIPNQGPPVSSSSSSSSSST